MSTRRHTIDSCRVHKICSNFQWSTGHSQYVRGSRGINGDYYCFYGISLIGIIIRLLCPNNESQPAIQFPGLPASTLHVVRKCFYTEKFA